MRSKLQSLLWAAMLAAVAGCSGDPVVGGRLDATVDLGPDVAADTQTPDTNPNDTVDVVDAADADDGSIDADVADADDVTDADDVVDVKDVPVDDGPSGCMSNADCATSSVGPVCDLITGRCVGCLPSSDTCPTSQHCDPASNTCVAGCRSDDGCAMMTSDAGVPLSRCDTTLHACVECATDDHCASGRLCRGNVCVPACTVTGCPTGQQCCAGACIDVTSNTSSCGACDTTCAAPNATPACRMGACAVGACSEGYADCDGAAGNGCEVDTRVSAEHCGGCGRACAPVPNAASSCTAGRCGYSCSPGFGDCDGDATNGCETDLRSQMGNCGSCGNICPTPPHGTAACSMGMCGVGTCETGWGNCDRSADNGCETDVTSSESNCGACGTVCSAGLVCDAGRCVPPCPSGFTRCSGTCASLQYDPANCGACGNRCATGSLCGGGTCVAACSAGQVTCSGGCTSTQTDASNCGACGNVCPAGNGCVAGVCRVVCVTGQVVCGGTCVDAQTNLLNCGSCGNVCGAGEQCMAGRCVLTCRAPQVVCGAECADLSRDPNHCGSCDRVCPTGCFDGACARADTVVSGTYNNCVRYTSGRAYCWGLHAANTAFSQGMLTASGGAYGHRGAPAQVLEPAGTALEGVEQIVMGSNRACVRLTGGVVRCWGYGVAMGAVTGLPAVTQLAATETNFCGLGTDRRVYCWDGQPRASSAPALTAVSLAMGAVEVVAGATFTCARLADNSVQCWGTGTSGQLGNGASVNSTTPVTVRGLTDATALTAGQNFACARRSDGTVMCWGLNTDGQLGDNSVTNRNAPVAVSGLAGVTVVRAGLRHACAIRVDGTLLCWGDNNQAQLGDNSTTDRRTPVAVMGLTGQQRAVSTYDHHTCAISTDRRVFCWGYNPFGEAGGDTELVTTPRPVQYMGADLTNLTDVQSGASSNVALMASSSWHCALHSDGRVFCWGSYNNGNQSGQLGDGTTTQRGTVAPVTGLTDATQIAVGWLHACALRRGGTVVCWGSNAQNQIGDGTTTNRTTPVAVTGLTSVVEIRSGYYHTCARRADGSVWCWGYNYYGELGNGTMINNGVAAPVTGISTAVQIDAGANHTCARLRDATVVCWGRNIELELGDGFRTNRSAPYPVQAPSATTSVPVSQGMFADVQCDLYRCYGALTTGTVMGWGWTYPVRSSVRSELSGVVRNRRTQVFSEPIDTECETRTDGITYCRGRNEFGQVGIGRASFTEAAYAPITPRLTTFDVGRGYGAPCGVERTSGRVLCWGWAGFGNLLATGADAITRRPFEVFMP